MRHVGCRLFDFGQHANEDAIGTGAEVGLTPLALALNLLPSGNSIDPMPPAAFLSDGPACY